MNIFKRVLTVSIILFLCGQAVAQTTFRHRVIIEGEGFPADSSLINKLVTDQDIATEVKFQIYEMVTEPSFDTLIIDTDSEFTTTKELTDKGIKYSVIKKRNFDEDSLIIVERKKKRAKRFYLPKKDFSANVKASKDSIYINFWLPKIDIPRGEVNVPYYDLNDEQRKWAPFHPDKTYFLKLKNRQYVSFPYRNYEISALTIPFKYHPGYSENQIEINPDYNADFNLSTFVGKRFGRVNYRYDKYDGMLETQRSFTVGLLAGLNSQKIDSASTAVSDNPILMEQNVPTLSLGAGVVFNVHDFNLGLFAGTDLGLGDAAKKWNYHKKLWYGIGFGYKIAFLKSSK